MSAECELDIVPGKERGRSRRFYLLLERPYCLVSYKGVMHVQGVLLVGRTMAWPEIGGISLNIRTQGCSDSTMYHVPTISCSLCCEAVAVSKVKSETQVESLGAAFKEYHLLGLF